MKTFILSIVFMLNLNAMAKIQQLELRYEKAVKFGNAVTFILPYFESEREVYPFVIPFQRVQYINCDRLYTHVFWEPYLCVDENESRQFKINLSEESSLSVVGSAFCRALGYKNGMANRIFLQLKAGEYSQNYYQLQQDYKLFVHINIRTGNFEIIRNLSGQEFSRMTELTCYE